jgi:hypothetical protein
MAASTIRIKDAFFLRGGFEAIYDDVPEPLGVEVVRTRGARKRGDVLDATQGRA